MHLHAIRRFAYSGCGLAVLVLDGFDPGQADQPVAVADANQANALCIAPYHGNVTHRRPHERAVRSDKHDFVIVADQGRAHRPAIPFARLDCNDTLAAPPLHRELFDRRTFAVTILCRR